jgi:uncharacterized membrane protein
MTEDTPVEEIFKKLDHLASNMMLIVQGLEKLREIVDKNASSSMQEAQIREHKEHSQNSSESLDKNRTESTKTEESDVDPNMEKTEMDDTIS